jgi:hypothetical protein
MMDKVQKPISLNERKCTALSENNNSEHLMMTYRSKHVV